MLNTEAFLERLLKVQKYYGLSATALADKIGVQRSGISHLLSGRNKPSLDFVLKLTSIFPEVNLQWLLKGEGNFPTEQNSNTISNPITKQHSSPSLTIDKIVIFYDNGSFKVFENS